MLTGVAIPAIVRVTQSSGAGLPNRKGWVQGYGQKQYVRVPLEERVMCKGDVLLLNCVESSP